MAIVSTVSPDGKRVEAETTIEGADRVLEALETGKKIKTRVTVAKAVKAAKAVEKKTGPVRGPNAVKAVKTGKNKERIARAFTIIRELKSQELDNKAIIAALVKEFSLRKDQHAVAWYWVNKAYVKANPEG